MSEETELSCEVDTIISTKEDLLPESNLSSSMSKNLVVDEGKVQIESNKELDSSSELKKEQWWLKKSSLESDVHVKKKVKLKEHTTISSDINSSTKNFLNKEEFFEKTEFEATKDKNKLQDECSTTNPDENLENTTDEDNRSVLEEISKAAEAVSPISINIESRSINELKSEEEKTVELLQKAEKLFEQNKNDISKNVSITDVDPNKYNSESLTRLSQLELDLFRMLELQTNENKDSEAENVSNLEKNAAVNKNTILQQKNLVLTFSDVCDFTKQKLLIEVLGPDKALNEKKNFEKEVNHVEESFINILKQKSKDSGPNLSSYDSNFNDKDFYNFLKLLQDQSNEEINSSLQLVVDQFDPLKEKCADKNISSNIENFNINSKEKLNELELSTSVSLSLTESKIDKLSVENLQKDFSQESSKKGCVIVKSNAPEIKKVVNDKDELYTIGLTPRLELFADSIPKLLAEKSNEANKKEEKKVTQEGNIETGTKLNDCEDFSFKNFKALDVFKKMGILKDHKNVTDVKDYKDLIDLNGGLGHEQNFNFNFNKELIKSSEPFIIKKIINSTENENLNSKTVIGKSESYGQLSKRTTKLGSSLENLQAMTKFETRKQISAGTLPKKLQTSKNKTLSTTIPRTNSNKMNSVKSKKEPSKSFHRNISLDIKGSQIMYDFETGNSCGGGGDCPVTGDETLESLYQDEMQRFLHTKLEMEAEIEMYKSKLKDLQSLNEREMFTLKKQNILLKTKLDEQAHQNQKSFENRVKYDPKLLFLQKEIDRQENLIKAYELENKKLIQETKRLQLELKVTNQNNQKIVAGDNGSNNQELLEKNKDLKEEIVKLNLEISKLKLRNNDLVSKSEDFSQQTCLLQEELEMIKDQLRAKNDFITDRLQSMTTNELELRKQVEDLRVELHSKSEQLKLIKLEYERFQQSVAPVENELLDLRAKCSFYQEKIQTSKQNCEREKLLTQKLKDQVIIDNKNIMDLNRQVREMERILKRKCPDSVSALILTANSENDKLYSEKIKLLEDRISFLESEIKVKEDIAKIKLSDLQKKFFDMKEKYSIQVLDLETKLKNTSYSHLEKKSFKEIGVQTFHRNLESRGSEPNLFERVNCNKPGPKSQNLKEDTHLIATIRGLKQDLSSKEKFINKVTKEYQELQKTNRKLQKEREKLLNDHRNLEKVKTKMMTSSDSKLSSLKLDDCHDSNSNFYQSEQLLNGKKSIFSQKHFNSTQSTDLEYNSKLKKLTNENSILKEELSKINKDLIAIKNKRLHDLNLLQEEHEKEIALIIKDCNVKDGDSQAIKLQGQLNSQIAIVSHFKQQIEKLQDYKEQVVILKAERDHLETKNKMLNDKMKYFSAPSSQQLHVLQEKITLLQQRHETRELSLQKLVRDLLRSQGSQSCKDCCIQSTKQKCYYEQELNSIVGALQNLTEL